MCGATDNFSFVMIEDNKVALRNVDTARIISFMPRIRTIKAC